MKAGTPVRVTRVWPGHHEFETVLREIPTKGSVFQVKSANLGVIEAVSWWSDPKKVFVHTADASFRVEKLEARGEE